MLKLVNLAHFSLIAAILLVVAGAPLKVKAQDDTSGDEDSFVAQPPPTSNPTPPTVIDEGDSGGVSDVEDYDN